MPFVMTPPEMLGTAARDWASIGAAACAPNAAATSLTTAVLPAANEVYAWAAGRFVLHARTYRVDGAQAAAMDELLVAGLTASGVSDAAAEATGLRVA
ncbi:PE family protein [Mycobacterium kansasii]|uniref:PE family protein n=3 Tax=Mycobacterium kansasii TaxID=1768 RepID=A0A653EYT7_MYCKA|nr:PE family protein [Mycobacterium kansasii]AGZ51913.1 PE family protein [Mycobacterium kansasii ATCC 12478]ARG56379.1 PE family protein [Mycobacterium kansasii]ARG61830.1 PE family protein [Mycobacterium kansasii]ARG69517.1 PE family protein [Mycobacterium kansasii]ARG75866.1 PE family protein [Mycobacterium kansasii]